MDPSEAVPAPERDVLRGGPDRAPLLDRLPPAWRRRGAVLLALVLGVAVGGGAAWWWEDRSPPTTRAPSPSAATGADVRLVLTEVVAPARPGARNGTVGSGPLRVDGVLLHSRGPGVATVTRIHRASGSVAIRVRALPVDLSVNDPIARIGLEITARDCALATEWTPSAQPFTLTWRDSHGDVHMDTGGDHEAPMELAMIRYLDRVCSGQTTR